MESCKLQIKKVQFADGRCEAHAIVRPANVDSPFQEQLSAINQAIDALDFPPLMVRYFVSDAANQFISCDNVGYAVSIVQQPPLTGEKVAAWVWMRSDAAPEQIDNGFWRQQDGPLSMLIKTGDRGDCQAALELLDGDLRRMGGSLADSCLRTWLFVRDIDRNYAEVVAGRNRAFATTGVNASGHFIASTGIQGSTANPDVTLLMDSVSYIGADKKDITYLQAREQMNPTMEYGVAFERATSFELPGRKHVFVSGTASINNRGEVMHVGDVIRQSDRMISNIEALLSEAGCTLADAMHFLIYLRDGSDAAKVERYFSERFPDIPRVLLLAPVCRPQWLIEMECMAVK